MKVRIAGIRIITVAMLSLGIGACGASEQGSDELKLGLNISDEATAQAVGLPAYPGSKPFKDGDDSSAADIGISTPLFGLKVVALELETPDAPERVAAFYRTALSKYGEIVECSKGHHRESKNERTAASDVVKCDAGEPGEHSIVYKVGTEKNQRIVAIKPHGRGTQFNLVHVNIRGDE